MDIVPVETEAEIRAIRVLFGEYFAWVRDEVGIDLDYQGVDTELATLPGVYAPPAGCLLLARDGLQAAACVALKPHEPHICEMKRMYVRPEYRGRGLATELADRVIAEARTRGYQLMRLDTADTLYAAQHLYRKLGFSPAEPYYQASPEIMARVRFMSLAL